MDSHQWAQVAQEQVLRQQRPPEATDCCCLFPVATMVQDPLQAVLVWPLAAAAVLGQLRDFVLLELV
jgi:hypothetical protein